MAFNANDRVIVTNQTSPYRNQLGTVITKAADSADGFNRVRIDGFPEDGHTVPLADGDLAKSDQPSPISY